MTRKCTYSNFESYCHCGHRIPCMCAYPTVAPSSTHTHTHRPLPTARHCRRRCRPESQVLWPRSCFGRPAVLQLGARQRRVGRNGFAPLRVRCAGLSQIRIERPPAQSFPLCVECVLPPWPMVYSQAARWHLGRASGALGGLKRQCQLVGFLGTAHPNGYGHSKLRSSTRRRAATSRAINRPGLMPAGTKSAAPCGPRQIAPAAGASSKQT